MSGRKPRVGLAALVSAFLVASVVPVGRAADEAQEWRFYGGDAGARKYSPLDQINRNNVKNLRIAWRQSATPQEVRRDADAPVPYYYSHTPLMAGGLLYMSTGYGTVAALDAGTGKVVWSMRPSLYANRVRRFRAKGREPYAERRPGASRTGATARTPASLPSPACRWLR